MLLPPAGTHASAVAEAPVYVRYCPEHGFLRKQCEQCHAEQLVACSCKKRGFCPSCGARRMAEIAALCHGIHMTSIGGD